MSVFQNSVLVGSGSVAGMFDGTGTLGAGGTALPAVKTTGLISNMGSGSTNTIDNFNPRPAVAFTPKIALKPLTLTSQMLAANQEYAGVISGYTGTPNMNIATDASGLFTVDGFNLRSTGPLGASGTSYSVTVGETSDNAVNSPRTSTFTIVAP